MLNWEKRHNEEFADWLAEHLRKLKTHPNLCRIYQNGQDVLYIGWQHVVSMVLCFVLSMQIKAKRLKICMDNFEEEAEIYGF